MRTSIKTLEAICKQINFATGSPSESWKDGKAQIGNFHLSQAYGGVCLLRHVNGAGGVSCPLGEGHKPKKELEAEMRAFYEGLTH